MIIGTASNGNEITLNSVDLKSPINDADWLTLVSDGWGSHDAARNESVILVDILCRALSFHNFGADLGRRTPGGGFFRVFLDDIEKKSGRNVLNDERGPMVYATELDPMIARVNDPSSHFSVSEDKWASTFQNALNLRERFTDKERMAFDLFSMAHKSSQSVDARFVLLFAAFETLLEPSKRPKSSQEHVNELIDKTKKADLPKSEKDSLVGSLQWLLGHSIRTRGRKIVRTRLGDTKYGDLSAEELFSKCYELRNRLLHGQQPLVEWREISNIAGPFEQMLSHLLSGKLRAK